MMLKLSRFHRWLRLICALSLALSLLPRGQSWAQDADESEEGEPPPEDAGSGNPVVEASGEGAPEPEDQDFRPDLIELRVAFDDRLGKAAEAPYVLIRPDNDPQTIRCELKDDGSDVQDIKGDLVYTCSVKSQRTQSVILGVFHSPGGTDVEIITRKIKLPSAPSATIAFRAPKNYETGTFKIMDPFFFMEPDPESDAGGVPSAGAEGGAVVSVLGSETAPFEVAGSTAGSAPGAEAAPSAPGAPSAAAAPGTGASTKGAEALIDGAPEQSPEDEAKNPAIAPAPSVSKGGGYVLPIKTGGTEATATGSGVTTSKAQEAGEVGAFSIPNRAVSLKGVWAAISLLFLIQFLRMGLVERSALGLMDLKERLIASGKEGPAKIIPDLRPLATTLGRWVGRPPGGVAPHSAQATAPPDQGPAPVYRAPRGPTSLQLLAGAIASRIGKGNTAGAQGLSALLPDSATLFRVAPYLKGLHAHQRLEFHLWDGFKLPQGVPTALIVDDDLRLTLLSALAREAAGRHRLPTLILTTERDGFGIERNLLSTLLQGIAYPGMDRSQVGSLPQDKAPDALDSRPPDIGDRVVIAPGPHRDLAPLMPYIKGALGESGALVIIIDRLSAPGLTDDLVSPDRMVEELLTALEPALSAGAVYPFIVDGPKQLEAFKAAGESTALTLLELAPGPPGDLIEAKTHGGDNDRQVHLEVEASSGWMWSTWQSDPVPPLRHLHSLIIDEHSRDKG